MDYYRWDAATLRENARIPLKCLGDSGEVFYELALDMVRLISERASEGKTAVLILPVGPVGQYPIFARLVNERGLSLKHCWFFNMDEYLAEDGGYIDTQSRLSFRGFMRREVYGKIHPELLMPEQRRVFPDPKHPSRTDRLLDELGGADLAVGGIGLNGHLAFNEPEPGLSAEAFLTLPTRTLDISAETRASNAIGDLGGAVEAMPRACVTLGMRQIYSAKQVRLGVFRDWHRAAVRRAACGPASPAFPASLLQAHSDALIYVNANAARLPW